MARREITASSSDIPICPDERSEERGKAPAQVQFGLIMPFLVCKTADCNEDARKPE